MSSQQARAGQQKEAVVRSINFQGIKVTYDTYGTGNQALVFVHGWTCSKALWLYQDPLYTKHRSILIDLPGHGDSDKPSNADYNLELFARSVGAVIQAEGICRAVLIAHSMGGPISTMLLRLFPGVVAGIVYLDSFWQMPESYLTMAERRELGAHRFEDINFISKVNELFADSTPTSVRDMVRGVMMATPRHVRVSACTTESQPHALPWETTFAIPALQLAAPGATTDGYWHHHMPRLEVRELSGVGHFLFMEDAKRVNAEVEYFLIENKLLV